MILCDREIKESVDHDLLVINPHPDDDLYASTSVDLRLDHRLSEWVFPDPVPGLTSKAVFDPADNNFSYQQIEAQFTKSIVLGAAGYELKPGGFVLGFTHEKIYLPHRSRICARVEGKSSLARMGLGVHVTAPTIHAGFGYDPKKVKSEGTPIRLEIWNTGPIDIRLRPMMRICQLIIEEVRECPTSGYISQFNAQGPGT